MKASSAKLTGSVAVVTGASKGIGAAIAKALATEAKPQDIAGAAVFLASSESAWITGETLLISGGLR